VKTEQKRTVNLKLKDCSPKGFWHCVNGIMGRVNSDESLPIKINNITVQDESKPDLFAAFFQKKVNDLIEQNPLNEKPACFDEDENCSSFTRDEIRYAMSTFKCKRSSGPDDIPLVVLKHGLEVYLNPLERLFSLILIEKKILTAWKVARIKPIHKKGERSDVCNYRPISNLNSFSKLFERCILNRIADVDDGPNQHGFKVGHSTTTAGLDVQSAVASALQDGKKCLVYSMDLTAAFDLIRPDIFCEKMSGKINNVLLQCLSDFLKNRKAFVEIGDQCSQMFQFKAGCPQGSTLGPKIFSLYCSDLNAALGDVHTVSYADDTYVVVSADCEQDLLSKAKETIKKHVQWLRVNGMVCNVSKTEVLYFEKDRTIDLDIDGIKIRSTPTMKVLGLQFDTGLTWEPQVMQSISKTTKLLHGLKFLRRHLDVNQMKQVTTSYLFSVLFYGSEIWFHKQLSFHLKQKIRSIHYKALRLTYGRDLSRDMLDKISGRATPDEWADFCLGKLLIHTVRSGMPHRFFEQIIKQYYTERRVYDQLFIYDSSTKKIGRQILSNRLATVSKAIKFPWLRLNLSKSVIRMKLKETFFMYAKKNTVPDPALAMAARL